MGNLGAGGEAAKARVKALADFFGRRLEQLLGWRVRRGPGRSLPVKELDNALALFDCGVPPVLPDIQDGGQ